MKKSSCAIEFSLILVILILPAIIFQKSPDEKTLIKLTLTLPLIFMFLFSAGLYFQLQKEKEVYGDFKAAPSFSKLSWGTVTLGLLFLTSSLMQILACVFKLDSSQGFSKPDSLLAWILTFTAIAFSAFYEESVYRFYLPRVLNFLFFKKHRIASEIIASLLFSLAHLYLGLPAFINAILASAILRLCALKTNSILPGFISHGLYNLTTVIILTAI